jgi:ribonuclease R
MMENTMSADRIKINGLTIDGSESRDLDDAFWLESVGDMTLLHVSITDVSDKIKPDSALDKMAQEKGFTRYLSDGNNPMLPHEYSENSLSLLEGKCRNTITLSVSIDQEGNIDVPLIRKTYLHNQAKLSYKQAEEIMRSPQHPLYEVLNQAHQLAQRLFEKRRNDGAIALYDLNKGIATSEDGVIQQISADESYNSHIIIQEFMILINQVIARFFAENDIPGLYRNHTSKAVAPERESLLKDVDNIMKIGDSERIKTLVQKFMLIFNKASYDPVIEGHYALNLPAYMHITSPIRRYVDLINMRQLSAFLTDEKLPYSIDALRLIGKHINTIKFSYQKEKSSFFKGQAHEQNVEILNNNIDLSTMEGNDLHRLLKTAAYKNKLPPNLHTKISEHLENHKLSVRDMFTILFNSGKSPEWMALKTMVLEALSENIHESTSLLTMVSQKRQWSAIRYQREAVGEQPQTFYTIASMTIKNKDYDSDSQKELTIKNKKVSEQLANFNLLCKILKIDKEILIPSRYQQQDVDKNTSKNQAAVANYVGKLVELCNRKGWPTVQYEYTHEGPSHQPIFEVQAHILIKDTHYYSEKIQGGNKKLGKQLASADLMQKLVDVPTSASATGVEKSANFIGMLNNLMLKQNQEPPCYNFDFSEENGPFKCICTVTQPDDENKKTQAYGASKKNTKKEAAKRMWLLLSHEIDKDVLDSIESY